MSMNIKLVRVDNRLIHATISLNWNRFLAANHVITVENIKVADEFIEKVLRLSLPKNTKLSICTPSEFVSLLKEEEHKKDNVIVVFKDFSALCSAVSQGFSYPEVQIPYPASRIMPKTLLEYFGKEDIKLIRDLQKDGMKFYFQTSPMDSKTYVEPHK